MVLAARQSGRACFSQSPFTIHHSPFTSHTLTHNPVPRDPLLEARVADVIGSHNATAEPKKMFGGVAFMVRGHMAVGISNKGDLMIRFDGARHAEISGWPGAKPMTYGKGDMKGFLFVDPEAVKTKAALDTWVTLALAHNATQPVKPAKKPAKKPAAKKTAPKSKIKRTR